MIYEFDGKQPQIGNGTFVADSALVIGDVQIGDNCYIGHGAILRGDYGRIEIGDGTAVEEGVIIHVPPNSVSRIGQKVTFGHGAIIHSEQIDDWAVVGMGAIISVWAKIGAEAIVAEGAVVTMKQVVPEKVMVAGNPAKVIRKTAKKDYELWSWGKQIYIDLAAKYLKIGMHRLDSKQ